MYSILLFLVPSYTVFELDAGATKDIQCAADGQVDLAIA
jgi:hypothetical protein